MPRVFRPIKRNGWYEASKHCLEEKLNAVLHRYALQVWKELHWNAQWAKVCDQYETAEHQNMYIYEMQARLHLQRHAGGPQMWEAHANDAVPLFAWLSADMLR